MTSFLNLFMIFCSSAFFETLLSVLVPIVLVSACLSIVGVILYGKSL